MKKVLANILNHIAKAILKRYEPRIVAVTGSIGKTSTVRAISAVLARSFSVRHTPKNFNNELGVPLSIIGATVSGGKSPIAWVRILSQGMRIAYGARTEYPKVLVLEMGADRPGDLAKLVTVAKPDVSVVTAVSAAHTEFLGSIEGVAREKAALVEVLEPEDIAVLNGDDEMVAAMAAKTRGQVMRYGMEGERDVKADAIQYEAAMGTFFTCFDLLQDGKKHQITLSEAIGIGNVYAALAAATVAEALGAPADMTPYGLAEFQPPAGRLRVLPGIKGTVLIDDTYNSSPRAAAMALDVFSMLEQGEGGRKIAVLGDMLELGPETETFHAEIGRKATVSGVDILIGIGPISTHLCAAARAQGMSEDHIFHMDDALSAGKFLQDRIHEGDVLLLKGSQGIRVERAVKELMAEPERASELLVRQSASWA